MIRGCRPGAGAPGRRAATAPRARSGTRTITSIRCFPGSARSSISAAWKAAALDIAWTSELDPAWLDDELSFLLNPEAALFANLPAQAACAADCAASSVGLPLDPMFWCAGCQGGMYPLTGNVAAHVGGVQASLLAAQRLVYRLHRLGLAWGTYGSGGALRALPDAGDEEIRNTAGR